jgi:RNA polymerase-binding transcription factor DksA
MAPMTIASPLSHARLVARLTARRDELEARLHAAVLAATQAGDAGPQVRDFKDAASDEWDTALTDAGLAQAAEERDEILAALRRIQDGTYGVCTDCGGDIDGRRLQALPAAALCATCQDRRERLDRPGAGGH